jgi:bifunctional DNA-binding transcriptional regulator/antitoxin component of YhaV-PrlF toxin-antitoxin module
LHLENTMLAKMTAKNQLTLPKAVTKAVGDPRYYEIRAEDGQIVLTPVRIQRADAVRAKLAELEISEKDVEAAVTWARSAGSQR